MKKLKQHIRWLLAADEMEKALEYLLQATNEIDEDLQNELILQSAQIEHLHKLKRQNTQDFGDLVRTRNKINLALIDLTDKLPEDIPLPDLPESKTPQGISENKLKDRLFLLLGIAKLLIIGFVFTLWQSGSFSAEQFTSTVGLLLPIFASYFSIMFKDKIDRRDKHFQIDKYVTKSFQRTAYFTIIIYTITLFIVINLYGPGIISFGQMNTLLALVEIGLGAYVGKIIFNIFKENK